MFWNKKSPNDLMLESAQEYRKIIEIITQLQAIDFRYSLLGRLTKENIDFKKAVSYVYYDTLAYIYSYELAGKQNDVIKGYLRDSALASLEAIGEAQYRTFAAAENDYTNVQKKLIHSLDLLKFLESAPVFDEILRMKVLEKVKELNELWGLEGFGEKIKTHLGDLVSDEVLLKSLDEPTEVTYICCGGCNERELLENINTREDAKLYLYKTNERRTADDLDIYSSICFDCGAITEFSFDPYNFSGNATEGVEYFRSYSVDKSALKIIFEQMRNMGHLNAILRLVSKHPDKLV
jgi:hypothetical protein